MRRQEDSKDARRNLLDELSIEEWKSVCPSLAVVDVTNKSIIYRQGDKCDHVFWIVSGHVKLSRLTANGDELTNGFLSQGELFGCLPPGHAGDEAEETVATKGATQLYRVSPADFKKLLSSRPELAWQIIEMMAGRRRTAERKLESILFDDVQHRLVKTLYDLSERFGGPCPHGYTIELYFTHQEIADMVGASRPVVSTMLSDFKEQKLLDYSKDAVCLMQEEIFSRYLPA